MAAAVNTVALLAAAPFPSHEGHGAAEGVSGGFPFLTSVSLYVLVVLVGTLLAPALTRVNAGTRARAFIVEALALSYAGLVIAQVARHQLSTGIAAGIVTVL